MPQFHIDYNNKELDFLNTTTYPKYIISLLDANDEEKMRFNLNLLELSFLGKDLYKVSIYHYPMLILEFMNGNYTTTELFIKNEELIKGSNIEENSNLMYSWENIQIDEIEENNKKDKNEQKIYERDRTSSVANINPNMPVVKKNEDRSSSIANLDEAKKQQQQKKPKNKTPRFSAIDIGGDSKLVQELKKENTKDNLKKTKEKKKSKKISIAIKEKKIEDYTFDNYFNKYFEKITYFRDEIKRVPTTVENKSDEYKSNEIENYQNIIEIYKRKERIKKIKEQIEFYKNKDQEIDNIKQRIQLIISNKSNLLKKLNEKITEYKIKYTELKTNQQNMIPIVAKNQLIYDSFLNKKMVEICFIFFNEKVKSIYFTDFLKNTKGNENNDLKKRFDYYNKYKKVISSMIGYITQLMIYMSKCFDIPLRYPLMLNGSKSFIVRGKKDKEKDFLPLHCDLKRDDKHGNFETGLNYLKDDLREIINFCSMYPEIIPEDNLAEFEKDNDENLFFYYFINFNHCLCNFVKNIQKIFE